MPRPEASTALDPLKALLQARSTCRSSIALDKGWQFKQQGLDKWHPAQHLPTNIHLDLIANGTIQDPFPAKNEENTEWIGKATWIYRTSFEPPADALNKGAASIHLVFEGLDTFATVKLDEKVILESDDMFLCHRINISKSIAASSGPHSLEIVFEPAEQKGDEEVERHPEHSWTSFNSGAARLATRKAQFHYGWDWGPKMMTCGPWRPIFLDIFESRITDLSARSTISNDLSVAQVDIAVETEGTASFVVVNIEQDGALVASEIRRLTSQGPTSMSVKVQSPKLWWPHTFGQQHFYHVKAQIYGGGQLCDSTTKRIGLRRVELVRQPLRDQEGSSFFFKINNQPIYAGGSNWIPGDMFAPRISADKYRQWIQLAKDSNQVMIRVWGGGIYEPVAFYDICDELGILVWQDFMLACGLFPAYQSFCDKVELETIDNVRKLRHHPSIVLWCGNNEDYVIPLLSSIEYDAKETDPTAILKSPFPARYIYEHIFPKICSDLVPDIPYWPGSPFGGDMVNSVTEGDCHQWHVWHLEKFPYQDFRRLSSRFASEFGMQGMPCMKTVQEFFPVGADLEQRKDWLGDEYVNLHNKCAGGHETLHQYAVDNLNPDTNCLRSYVHATQLIQSEAIATAYRSWRRDWRGAGKEYCGGALVWQLNDCYPATSWALADYKLRPKMAYWAMKRENQPISAGLQRKHTEANSALVEAWAVNSSLRAVSVDVTLRAWDVRDSKVKWEKLLHSNLTLQANQSTELASFDLARIEDLHSTDGYRHLVFALDLTAPRTSYEPLVARSISRSVNFHEPLKDVPFAQPSAFELRIFSNSTVEVTSDTALKGVSLEVSDAEVDSVRWDDNGFDLLPGQAHLIGVRGLQMGEEYRLRARWLGGEMLQVDNGARDVVRASL